MRTYMSVVLVTSIIPSLALAQREPISGLERGAKIRITAPTVLKSESIGWLDSITADSIQFRPDSHRTTRSVSLASVRTLEVSQNTGTRASKYAVAGGIVAGIVGFIGSNHEGQGLGTGKTGAAQNALVGGIAGVAIGGAIGWWYGGKKKVESWRPVDR